jgi:hypothetical protein
VSGFPFSSSPLIVMAVSYAVTRSAEAVYGTASTLRPTRPRRILEWANLATTASILSTQTFFR